MSAASQQDFVDLGTWDLGDVLAVVHRPDGFEVPRAWMAGAAAEVAAIAAFGAFGAFAPVSLLVLKALRKENERPAHVALMAVGDARRLAQRQLLFFPNGGPAVGQVYGRHPLRMRDYLPYASLHREVLHEKSIEAARYLLSLGARDVEIKLDQSTGKDANVKGAAALPSDADVSLGMGFGRDKNGDLAIRVTGAGRHRPKAQDLIWPHADPVFKLARDAARAGAATFHFGVNAGQTSSVNAEAAVRLQKDLNLGIGGEYKRWEDLRFMVDATFEGNGIWKSRSE